MLLNAKNHAKYLIIRLRYGIIYLCMCTYNSGAMGANIGIYKKGKGSGKKGRGSI